MTQSFCYPNDQQRAFDTCVCVCGGGATQQTLILENQ